MKYSYFGLLFLVFIISGCEVEEGIKAGIVDDIPIVGWITRGADEQADKERPNKVSNTDNLNYNPNKENYSASLDKAMKDAPKVDCPENQFWNQLRYRCECEQGYFMLDGRCVSESLKQCTFDKDCGTDYCSDNTHKRVFRCDLRSFRCVNGKGVPAETIDCKEYGSGYACKNGNCVG